MSAGQNRAQRQLTAMHRLLEHLAGLFESRISVRLWDGTLVPLGQDVDPNLYLSISGPGVVGSLIRKPTPDNLLRHYAQGHIDFHGADILTFIEAMAVDKSRRRTRQLRKRTVLSALLPFVLEPAATAAVDHEYRGNVTGRDREQAENRDFIQFHYDASNEFYSLFLDQEMVYSCGYFTDWNNSLDQAQHDKLDMICRKLQLKPGERFLDIGFGWGGLVCHAARHYGVQAHGITLSDNQLAYAREKVQRLGLQDRVTLVIRDYAHLEGEYDKIASIGMYEHIGIDNLLGFVQKVRSLTAPHGLFLLHGITRPGKESMKKFRRMNAERRLLAKHIFPGGELDHLGHIVQSMEAGGFEVHDVEGWRNHYMLTCRLWCQRLYERREEAIRHVGPEKYRMWLLYLAACSLAFQNGGARLYQVLGEKHAKKQPSAMPPTRAHLYQPREEAESTRRRAA